MKPKYKFLVIVLLLWIGMSYEGSRGASDPLTVNTTSYLRLDDKPLNQRIQIYEAGLVSHFNGDYKYVDNRGWIPEDAYRGNLVARAGRNVGDGIESTLREFLRRMFMFFDGVIS